MDRMGAFESFVCAVQAGSLSGAARKRKTSQPAVSQQISALENFYGVRLLHRDRNGVRLTEAGDVVFKRAVVILHEQKKMQTELETLSGDVAGHVRVSTSLGLSQYLVSDVIINLAKQYPELKVLLRADDQVLNLAAENIDIALRFGNIGNSSGIVRKIATLDVVLVATPTYLKDNGRPENPGQLINLDYIQYRADESQTALEMFQGSKKVQAPIKIGLSAQHPNLISKALNSNLGYAKLPVFMVDEAINSGKLEIVLPQWTAPASELFLVYPVRETLSPRIVAFLTGLFGRLEITRGANLLASAKKMLA